MSYDRLGRDLSILGDGKGVAWASNTEAGALIWNGSEWQDAGTLEIVPEKPRFALNQEGDYLVLGVPFERLGNCMNAGVMLVYEWGYLGESPSLSPSLSQSPSLPLTSLTEKPSILPSKCFHSDWYHP